MLLSQSDATSSSIPTNLLLVLIFPAILCFFSIHDAPADDFHKGPFVPLYRPDSLGMLQTQGFQPRGRMDAGFSILPPYNSGNLLLSPISGETRLGEIKLIRLSPDDEHFRTLSSQPVWPRDRRNVFSAGSKTFGNSALFKSSLAGGAIYRTAGEDRDSRFTMDFFVPIPLSSSSALFFESRAEYQDLFSRLRGPLDHRLDLGFGLGWRKVSESGLMFGTNVFWDASRLGGDWYSSAGWGLEMAIYGADGMWDVMLNFYRGGGIDLQTGFTFPIWEDRLDMRIFAEKYRFFDGEFILGSKGGVEISSPNRLLSISYELGQDSRYPEYHAIACSLTVPFSLEKVFSGKNPFEFPARPDPDIRYSERLKAQGVKRAWRQPGTVVEARITPQGERWTTPGKLSDTILWSTKGETKAGTASSDDSKTCRKPKDCSCERPKKEDEERSLGGSLLSWLLGTKTGGTILAVGATYLAGDYAYRNAFGPFEIEPYELERIKQEMPKKQRRK
ncbi:MAG: hypothetical protein AB1473_04575 [Thermodesulfobacteriota bacterium]